MKAVSGNFGMKPPVVRTMSTVDGQWLQRDLDVDYCWDNTRRPVLFGTAIDKIVKENGSANVLFLEIAPHPVLQSYIQPAHQSHPSTEPESPCAKTLGNTTSSSKASAPS